MPNSMPDPKEAPDIAARFYHDLYSAPPHNHTAYHPYIEHYAATIDSNTQEALSKLNNPISQSKTKATLKKAKLHSSPGPDLLPYKIYKLPSPSIITPVLTDHFNNILTNPKTHFTNELAKSHVTLIHKGGDPTQVTNYHPISLLNAEWKLLLIIMAAWLNKSLSLIITTNQHGFVPKQQAVDAVLDLYSTYAHIIRDDSLKNPFLLLLDFKKAFNSVHHDYLLDLLQAIGIPPLTLNLL